MRRNRSDHFSRAQRLFAVIVLVAIGYTTVALVSPIPRSRAVLATPTPTLTVQGYLAPGNTVRINGGLFIPGETATLSYDTTVFATVKVVQRLSIIGTYVGLLSKKGAVN